MRYGKEIRLTLLALAAPSLLVGIWALASPSGFHDDFPGGGRHWLGAFGPYNEHMVRDFGSLNLALGFVLVFAARSLDRRLVQAAAGATLFYALPHLIYHVAEIEKLGTLDNVLSTSTLALLVVVPIGILMLTRERQTTVRVRTGNGSSLEGVRYGTR
jgi:hypothetical protein